MLKLFLFLYVEKMKVDVWKFGKEIFFFCCNVLFKKFICIEFLYEKGICLLSEIFEFRNY